MTELRWLATASGICFIRYTENRQLNFIYSKTIPMKHFLFLISSLWWSIASVCAQVNICNHPQSSNDFPLVTQGKLAEIYIDNSDYEVVRIAANLFAEDIHLVSGYKCKVQNVAHPKAKIAVVAGTLGYNKFIDRLVEEGKIDVSDIRNGWEQFKIQTLKYPAKGIEQLLVIVGCDRRGTAYGLFTISEAIGVSPLYWWSDVPVRKQKELYLSALCYTSKTPSVKYRGIFINDEGWGLQPWAAKNFEKEIGNIGPKTYAKVCELLLRMKGNMLAPAMHPATKAFNLIPENREIADQYAIVITSSHCEPLLYNNTTEWNKTINGEWNYMTNKKGIQQVLDRRMKEVAPYENVYVLAMRGIHDAGLVGIPEAEKVTITQQALHDQRCLISKHVNRPLEEVPQVFVPYKEVLDIYEKGMNLPEDVTIVWPDDNYGYIKRLSNKEEQKRKGGSGVYYHISYLGGPHDYLWLNTTPNTLIYEEMKKAYDTGANRYWLLNVGDIKPGELGMKFFLDLAWDIDHFNFEKAFTFNADYLSSLFGKEHKEDLHDIMTSYFQLGFQRKPEAMGWGMEWNASGAQERITNTDFSFINYEEAENRLHEYDRIANKSAELMKQLPQEYQAAFFELVFYPVKGAALMNKKMLFAQLNRRYAIQGRAATQNYAELAANCHDSIQSYTKQYNSLLNGKWDYMMQQAPGWVATYQNMPPTSSLNVLPKTGNMQIFVPGKDTDYAPNVLPGLNVYTQKETFIELYNTGSQPFDWKATTEYPWLKLGKTTGTTLLQERIPISVNWNQVPAGTCCTAEILITSNKCIEKVYLPIFKPQTPAPSELEGLYIEENGCVAINTGLFHRKVETDAIKINCVKGLSYELESVQLGKAVAQMPHIKNFNQTPRAEYDFYTFSAGTVTVHIYALPLFPVNQSSGTRYGVMIDNGLVHWMTTDSKEYSGLWNQNVIRNTSISVLNLNIEKPGKHTLNLICGDPGVIIQKVVIDFGGMKRSYLGTKPTFVK